MSNFFISCTDLGTNVTEGALDAINRKKDSLANVARVITDSAATRIDSSVKKGSQIVNDDIRQTVFLSLDSTKKTVYDASNFLENSLLRAHSKIVNDRSLVEQTKEVRDLFTGQEMVSNLNTIRDSLLGNRTKSKIQSLIRESVHDAYTYADSIDARITEQRYGLTKNINFIITVFGIVLFVLISLIGFIYLRGKKYQKLVSIATNAIDSIEDEYVKKNVVLKVKKDVTNQNLRKEIDKEINKNKRKVHSNEKA